jgi:hypothetical protein
MVAQICIIAQSFDMLTSKYCLKLLEVPPTENATSFPTNDLA